MHDPLLHKVYARGWTMSYMVFSVRPFAAHPGSIRTLISKYGTIALSAWSATHQTLWGAEHPKEFKVMVGTLSETRSEFPMRVVNILEIFAKILTQLERILV
jgi:hypothetical protein